MWTKSFDVKKLLAMGISMAMVAFFMTACSDDDDETSQSLITSDVIVDVVDEDGELIPATDEDGRRRPVIEGVGRYEEGEQVVLEATYPIGWDFVEWVTDDITLTSAQRTNPRLTFTMPAHEVFIEAVYEEAEVYEARVTVQINGEEAGLALAGVDDDYQDVVFAWEGETVYIFEGYADNDGDIVTFVTVPAWVADEIVEVDDGIWAFEMPDVDVTIEVEWITPPPPVTRLRFNWDLDEENAGRLEYVDAEYEEVEFWYDVIYDTFEDVCDIAPEDLENEWSESECAFFLSNFPRYMGIHEFPVVFDIEEAADSRRNEYLEIDNDANDLLTVGVAQFTAVAAIYDDTFETEDEDGDSYLIIANYEIDPATTAGEVANYTLIFDIGMLLEDDCNDSPEGQCIMFGEGSMSDQLLKGQASRRNFIRRVPGTYKVADGVNATFWVIRTSGKLKANR